MDDDAISDLDIKCITMGVNWKEPDWRFGVSPEEHYEIQTKKKRHDYPEPPHIFDTVEEWAKSLTAGQVVTAFYDYHEKWTWDTGDPADGAIYRVLEKEIKGFGGAPQTGDCYYDTSNECVYVYDGTHWLLMAQPQSLD